ncbi:MAG TPA: extracellular solute-binding protein [Stellaceae bacterium]|nr:extracellular solute-binding protein [Stellaceae bacterium]
MLTLVAALTTSAGAQVADPAKWAEIQKAALIEGELNVTGPPSPPLRAALSAAFKARHGITLNYFGETTGAIMARIDSEFKAGKLSIDAHIGGMSTCWVFAARGQLLDMNGKLVDPELLKPGVWRLGAPKLNELSATGTGPNDPKCAFQFTEWVFTFLFENPSVIKTPITAWNDLLKPEFKDKIVSFDVRSSGPGETPVAYLGKVMGDAYTKTLYVGQNVKLSTDSRQLAEWVARGEYPLGIGLVPFAVEIYRKQGLPIAAVNVNDGFGGAPLTGGFGAVMLFKNTPHPNAAQVFANWIGTKEAQEIYETNMMETSLRTDVNTGAAVPDYVRVNPNVKYAVDDYVYSYYIGERSAHINALKQELPR